MLFNNAKLFLRRTAAAFTHYTGQIKASQETASPTWRILMYHRVVHPEQVPYVLEPGMYVRPETFELHAAYLAAHCQVISLDDLMGLVAEKKDIPARTLAITFDDGWYDNYQHALPILRRYRLPATIFLATSYMETKNLFWTDLLCLHLNKIWKAAKGRGSVLTNQDPTIQQFLNGLNQIQNTRTLVLLVDSILAFLKKASVDERIRFLQALQTVLPLQDSDFTARSFLTWKEAKEMSAHNITFGSHSHSHQSYLELTPEEIKEDVMTSIDLLSSHYLPTTKVFCYPGGYLNHITQRCLSQLGVMHCLGQITEQTGSSVPHIISRTGIHEDIASTIPLFTNRVWNPRFG